MRITVFGQTGQVATELRRRATSEVTLSVIGRDKADFSDPDQISTVARSIQADAVINAVAYTAVDKAEEKQALATTVNGTSVEALAKACAETETPLVHISTDYVFDGSGDAPWLPDNQTGPLGAYGRSKLFGEQGIAASGARAAILRTSWVFSAHGNNFVKTMVQLGKARDRLTIVADQIGGPTSAASIADACLHVAQSLTIGGKAGVYHFAGGPDVSWADFAREIFAQSSLSPKVVDIPTSDFPTPAKRPSNSRLDCTTLLEDHGIDRPDWRKDLAEVLQELNAA